MSLHSKLHTNSTITTSGSSPVFKNPRTKRHILSVALASAPSGTAPTLLFAVMVSNDGVTFAQKGAALATLNAVGNQRTQYGAGTTQGQITEAFIRIDWAIGGSASPTFTNVSTYFTGLDC